MLVLPEVLGGIVRPFIKADWGVGGYFVSMRDTRLYDAYRVDSNEWVPTPELAAVVLLFHFLFGAALVFWGCQQKRWD